jgi:hypothetical protein
MRDGPDIGIDLTIWMTIRLTPWAGDIRRIEVIIDNGRRRRWAAETKARFASGYDPSGLRSGKKEAPTSGA